MHLQSLITDEFRLNPQQKIALKKLGLVTVLDLLYHFPVRYGDVSEMKNIGSLSAGETAVVFGKINGLKTGKAFRKGITMSTGRVEDESGSIDLVWFHQPYIAKMVTEESFVRIEGKVSERKGKLHFSNPKIETVAKLPIGVGDSLFGNEGETHTMYPVYPESRGITSNWFYHALAKIFRASVLDAFVDPLPEELLKKYSLPSLKTALIWIHTPQRMGDAEVARKRFAFEEVFFIQLEKRKDRIEYEKNPAFIISKPEHEIEAFIKRFPFAATNAQQRAIDAILKDFRQGHAMSRLLHGDVGSGKTAVAAATVFAVTTSRPIRPGRPGHPDSANAVKAGTPQNFGHLQTAYMCPTEILATQHFESFIKYFSYLNINIGLMTGSGCRKFPSKVNPSGWTDISRTQLLKWVANGEIPILIGTHALIQKAVAFKNLAYVIIDEQHRFGTLQRQKLVRKDRIAPHLLSMSATPIPRTLTLTVYGDLDISLLDEMPAGRKPIVTEIVLPNGRDEVYEKIKKELREGRQAYVICPRIDEPDPDKEMAVNAKSVTEEAKRLKKDIFKDYSIDILHSKMTPKKKDEVMQKFSENKTQILVATSVVEVGVNVPNATIIIIEGGERFGLAQLHQLRGRVIRGNHQAYCYVFADSKTQKTVDRLKAFKTAKNGFELAEYDLIQRGTGELYGRKQWGLSDVAMEALKNIKMVEAAREEAFRIIESDPDLSRHPLLAGHLEENKRSIHFE